MNVIVHGVQSVSEDWAQVSALLGETEVPDRRGRKGVPLPDDYSLRTEIDDLHAVLDRHENPTLIGHSYGGLIALLTARERDDLKALVLYEPALYLAGEILDRIESALREGDRDRALEIVAVEVAGEQPFRVEDPEGWLRAQDLVDTTFRELQQVSFYVHEPAEIKAPLTVILGERTEPYFGRAARDAGGELVTLKGEGHVAHVTNPELLAETIRRGSTTLGG
ncbi:alpha/beta hydrolase [Lentzea sp. NPDC051838]|uniref:alpha/beta fold hydrolase n=1 Tax=Lentzea sp. NPDC051838 TaxID=3154849 RepID=UPI0034177355